MNLARGCVRAPPALEPDQAILVYQKLAATESLDTLEHRSVRSEPAGAQEPERLDIQRGMHCRTGQQGAQLRCEQDAARRPAVKQAEVAQMIRRRHGPSGPALPCNESKVAVHMLRRPLAPFPVAQVQDAGVRKR